MFRISPLWQDFGDGAKNLMVLKELFHDKMFFSSQCKLSVE